MKLVRLEELTGEEILARSIMTNGYTELLSEGSKIRLEYIPKLIEMGIREVFIQDDKIKAQDIVILKEEITDKCREQVKSIISRHTYNNNDDSMIEISNTADSIISNILDEEDVVEKIFDIKERSSDIYEHSINVCSLAMLVSLKMRLKQSLVHDIAVGCLLHDLGLRYITVDYDNKSVASMNSKDQEEYKKHPIYGYSAIKTEDWLNKESKDIILCHHELINGMGYPLHIKDLSIGVRIVSVCDSFDELICGIGHERMKVHEAVEYLKSGKGTIFDTKTVDELLDFTAVYPSRSTVITSDGSYAIVIKQNKGFPERPILQLISDKDGKQYDELIVIDLLECNNVFIEKVID